MNTPTDRQQLPDFDDRQVRTVYEILCDCDCSGKPQDEHWEGWQARQIVAALTTNRSDPVGYFYRDASEDGVEWQHVADNQGDGEKFLPLPVVPLYQHSKHHLPLTEGEIDELATTHLMLNDANYIQQVDFARIVQFVRAIERKIK